MKQLAIMAAITMALSTSPVLAGSSISQTYAPTESLRPQLRPETVPSVVLTTSTTVISGSTTETDTNSLSSGNHLVQLGAYTSEETPS